MAEHNIEAAEREAFEKWREENRHLDGYDDLDECMLVAYLGGRRDALAPSEAPAITEQAPPAATGPTCMLTGDPDDPGFPVTEVRSEQVPVVNQQMTTAPAGEVPVDLRMLGYELEGVIIDVEQGHGFDDVCLGTIKRVRAALSAPPAVPPGYVIVPVEPTPEMIEAGMRCPVGAIDTYKAMLSVAPAAPQPTKEQP